MIDTHAHIDTEPFDTDREEMLARAFDEGVEYVIIPAIEEKSWEKQYQVSESDSRLWCAIGVHPHNSAEVNEETYTKMEHYIKHGKTIAVGETGLDYYYDFSPKETQQRVFRRHLQLAKKAGLPVIVHNRESDEDLIDIIREEQDGSLRGVLHCFSGTERTLQEALDLGFHVSFTGNITFRKTTMEDIVKNTPMGRMMIETDSPYMAPHPFRGKRNEPSKVRLIAEKISEYKSLSIQEVISMTTKTAKQLFNLPVLLIAFFMASALLNAQSNVEEEYFDESEEDTVLVNPYPKVLGIAPFLGSNTIVERQELPGGVSASVTMPGVFSWGFGIMASPLDFLTLQLSYMGSKSTRLSDEYEGILPDYHNLVQIITHWTPNPYNRVNVFGSLGTTMFFIKSNGHNSNSMGICGGVGFNVNVNTSAGLIALIGEWNLNFSLKNYVTTYINTTTKEYVYVNTSSFFSIVRVGLGFYPKLF